ncbi:BTB/POZ domain-containing protein 6-A [Aphelenchoides avenae]|nr:BTB/POZ domain-containing protein 6-A [Aphelenchus avenae]
MADVHFLVGTDDVTERLPAHKFILSTSSEVFHGQLNGNYEAQETIDVEDTTPDIFKLVLGYIYTDKVELTPDNAFPMLYLAKKYLLKNLVAQVTMYIATAYSGENAAKVLPHLHLVEGEHAESVLCNLLRRDLDIDELSIYNGGLDWAQAGKQLSFETDAREVFGNALKLI